MNLAALRAWVEQNKKTLAVAGAVGVGGLALVKRNSGGGPAGPDVDVTGAEAAAGAGAAYGLGMATGAYDSSSSDVYNAIQPQLEELGRLLDETKKEKDTPIPVVAPTPTSNQAWLAAAVGAWAKEGKNARDMQAAASQWLSGRPIAHGQQAGINWAVKKFGAPPEGTKGVSPIVVPKK